ncbi:MAG TPA: hypothetical protein VG847_01955 [Chitinophagaceae bacterium]|nr:hypothetical protein [Chitinophagaceae bacterium]
MSNCNFTIPFSGDAENILAKARAAVEDQNGEFTGDVNSGHFNVSIFSNQITGSYIVTGQLLHLTITHKPFLVPCSTIENFLRSRIS